MRSPVQAPEWYAAAGWAGRTEILSSGSASVPVWHAGPGEHPFHDPIALLMPGAPPPPGYRNALVTISPYGYRGGADGISPDELADLAVRLVERGREVKASLVMSHYLYAEEDGGWLSALAGAGGLPFVLGADAVLGVQWHSLADYYRWLGPSRRSQRTEARALADRGLLWARHDTAVPPAGREHLVGLLTAHARRFDRHRPPPRSLFGALVDGSTLPRLLLTVGPAGRPARSVLAVLRSGDRLHAKFFGTAAPRTDYFPLVYPALLSHAIELGARQIAYGGGSHQAKLLRGCRLRLGYAVLFVLDQRLRDRIEHAAIELGHRRCAEFMSLAQRFQHSSLGKVAHYAMCNGRPQIFSPADR